MKSFIALAILIIIGSANGGLISPYFSHHGYAPYVPIIKTVAPNEKEIKIDPPKEVPTIVAPLAPHYPIPHTIPQGVHYAAGYGYPASSQFHSQDEFGNLKFGYSNINSAKQEAGNTYGGVSGGYQYVDANGVLQSVSYVADGLGFRTVDSRLPVAPAVPEAEPLVQAPAPVFEGKQIPDAPEVVAAKEEFQKAYDAAAAATDES